MKRLLLILILTLSFQSWTKADDIRDFEIEGMSIGDSLLDYISEEKIESFANDYYPASKKLYIKYVFLPSFQIYESVTVALKENSFKIYGLSGVIVMNDFDNCLEKKKEIINDISSTFSTQNIDKGTVKVPDLTDNSSIRNQTELLLENDLGLFSVQCTDWSKKSEEKYDWSDNISISVYSKEYENFLRNEAY
tara:strand:- start:8 stop:586 length:579 start_codon:yes stop_codon:yes gene_type:complete